MKKIIFILIISSLYGCGLQRRTYCERKANKVARILKDCPSIIDTTFIRDTVVIRDTVTTVISAKVDTSVIDSLLKEYCDALLNEKATGKTDTFVLRIKEKIFFECSPEKVIGSGERLLVSGTDTVGVKFVGTKDGLNLSIMFVKKQVQTTRTLVVPCPECKIGLAQVFKDWWLLLLILFVFGLVAGLYRR